VAGVVLEPEPEPGAAVEPDFEPMFGQFFGDAGGDDPVEPGEVLDGVVLVEPDEVSAALLVVVLVGALLALVLGELVVVLVGLDAALAASAPPTTKPVVSAPVASTLRRWSFMNGIPSLSPWR
jgi:hypothetical protein